MTISDTHNKTPPCSVVIRCYNEEKYIGKLLHGISQQNAFEVEIILVDSGSSDGTLAIASRYPIKITTIKPDEFSFGRSLNLGCANATKEFIVIASAHVYPLYKNWLKKLLTPFNNPLVGLVYGRQIGGKVTKFSEHQVFAKWFPEATNADQNHPFCNNANAAIRRNLWEKYPYDERLTGLEDLDWAQRIMRAGHKIVYQSQAAVAHIHNEFYRQIYNRYRREAIALKRIFPNEQFYCGMIF